MTSAYEISHDLSKPLNQAWEVTPNGRWTFERSGSGALWRGQTQGRHLAYIRGCFLPGDTTRIVFDKNHKREGVLIAGFLAGFEFAELTLNFKTGQLALNTHEHHKLQPRFVCQVPTDVAVLEITRSEADLPGQVYKGSRLTVLADGHHMTTSGAIDLLPEVIMNLGLLGPGQVLIKRVEVNGLARPRPEFVHVGVWQQSIKPTTKQNVDSLIRGVKEAAGQSVEILLTPETSLTGLRPDSPELNNEHAIQAELARFQAAVRQIENAPHTLIGLPEWVHGSEVEGAELERVKVNAHRFVRPDGTLGPRMAKVHSCEAGLWHGRSYNLQRVRGVEIALGVCHDGRYQDVWSTGVMAGARLCFHAIAGGAIAPGTPIPEMLAQYRNLGTELDAFWAFTNAGGNAGIVYPTKTAKVHETLLALPDALTPKSPTWPDYSPMGDQLAHAKIRLWDATGCYPMRTLRNGNVAYKAWSSLMPTIVDV